MSKGWKIALIVGVVTLFLCGVACVSIYFIGQYAVSKTVALGPEQAARIGHEIADYTLPPGYAEQFGMNMLGMKWVIIGSDANDSLIIMMMQFSSTVEMNQEEMQRSMERSLEQQNQRRGTDFHVVGTQEATIKGSKVVLTVSEGKDEQGRAMRQVMGTFPGKGGTVMLMAMGVVGAWDQPALDAFLASIR